MILSHASEQHLIVLSTRSARSARMALKTRSTRNTRASNTPIFCTMRGMRKSMRLDATMAVSGGGGNEVYSKPSQRNTQ